MRLIDEDGNQLPLVHIKWKNGKTFYMYEVDDAFTGYDFYRMELFKERYKAITGEKQFDEVKTYYLGEDYEII